MDDKNQIPPRPRLDVSSLEADMAFFEARLSLAGEAPDTAYQRAQIKTYRILGAVLGRRLERMRLPREPAEGDSQGNAAA